MLVLGLSVTLTTILIIAARLRGVTRTAELGWMGEQWMAANRCSRS